MTETHPPVSWRCSWRLWLCSSPVVPLPERRLVPPARKAAPSVGGKL